VARILLIDSRGWQDGLFNLGLAYLASALKAAGHCPSVLDLNNRPRTTEDIVRTVREARADYVGFSVKSATFAPTVQLHERLSREIPAVTYLYGGPHSTLAGAELLADVPPAFVFRGEAESTLPAFIARHAAGRTDFADIPGLAYRDQDGTVRDNGVHFEAELDELCFPDFTAFDSHGSLTTYPLLTSRGCPYKCTYCAVPRISGGRWRARSADSVMRELEHVHDVLGLRTFVVVDDNFTVHRGRAESICRRLAADERRFTWSCGNGIRADRIWPDLARAMVAAGCCEVAFGVESLVPDVFGRLKKGETTDQVRTAVKVAREAGLSVTGFFMIGLPGSTYRRDLRTLAMARRMGLNNYYFGLTVPYPGTELWTWSQQHARFLVPWQNSYHISEVFRAGAHDAKVLPVFDTADYPAAQRARVFQLAQSVKTRSAKRELRDLNRRLRLLPAAPVVVLRTSRRPEVLDIFRGVGRNRPHLLLWTGREDSLAGIPADVLAGYRVVRIGEAQTFRADLGLPVAAAQFRRGLVLFDAANGSLDGYRNVLEFVRELQPVEIVALVGDRLETVSAAGPVARVA
jgi:radical SAM superfamily enzyme YgiQ (UPF0313 family)